VLGIGLGATALRNFFGVRLQLIDQAAHLHGIGEEGGGISVEFGFELGHFSVSVKIGTARTPAGGQCILQQGIQ
jgi:hypothetical protein